MCDSQCGGRMRDSELKSARERYNYIPARLVRAGPVQKADLEWGSLRLKLDVPEAWPTKPKSGKRGYTSIALDSFHQQLLSSDHQLDILHGLLSVVFCGFSSGADGISRISRALARTRWVVDGKPAMSIAPTPKSEVLRSLIECRRFLYQGQIRDALCASMKIKFLSMSFGSKVVTFLDPTQAAIYDSVIGNRLARTESLKHLYVNTNATNSERAKLVQADAYANWCLWCSKTADKLNNSGAAKWIDWDGTEQSWRAVDVERAFFALGR